MIPTRIAAAVALSRHAIRRTETILGRARILILYLAIAGVPGCQAEREKLPETQSQSDIPGVRVTVEPVTLRRVERKVGMVGTLHGYEEVSLGAKVAGRVKRISHDVSDRIAPGELLLEIEPTDYQLNVQQAKRTLQVELAKLGLTELADANIDVTRIPTVVEAQLKQDNALVRLERTRTLAAKKTATQEELTERLSEYRVAQAEYDNQVLLARTGIASIQVKQEALEMARQQLRDTLIKVPTPSQPIPGAQQEPRYAITGRSVSEGSYVTAGEELFKLVIEQPLRFRGTVPERNSSEVRLGQESRVYTSAYREPFSGQVTRINPGINPSTRTFEVEVLVPNHEGQLKPGGFAKCEILTAIDEDTPTVPLETLVYFAGVTKIFLVHDGRAKEVHVTLGVQATEWVEIASPKLDRDTLAVTSGQTAIVDGTKVIIRETVPDTESPRQPRDGGPLARNEDSP